MITAAAVGIVPGFVQCALLVLVILAEFGSAGLPGAATIYASLAPGLQIIGAPLAVIPLYVAVNGAIDLFVTAANVTADLTVTVLVAHVLRKHSATESAASGEA